ncbi:MAG: hypothetical protein MRERC_4c040 [Mycoplasmataceae bacterium RC_NB112A]|nr:MAG: hypothetical protein MRERC_4c040 [Mycoplasmataceae bacterium RC_NB112A]
MEKKCLQEWYNQGVITYSEKEKLNKIGISDYSYHYLQDLKQIIRCENWAKESREIRDKLNGRIKKIIFFTPNFNSGKLDASNYSCAIVVDGNDQVWAVSCRPSYVANIESDLMIEKASNISEVEQGLNSDTPIVGMSSRNENIFVNSFKDNFVALSSIKEKKLPYDVKNNPDKYLLPFDIIKRSSALWFDHYGIYIGNSWVVHLPGGGEPTQFDTWYKFCNPDSSSSGSSNSSSSSSEGGSGPITVYHPKIPFKVKTDIIRHVAKVVSYNYGRYSYNKVGNNCEHLTKRCVLGINESRQTENHDAAVGFSIFSMFSKKSASSYGEKVFFNLGMRIKKNNKELDELTYNYSSEKERIKRCIREAENSRSYTCSKYQVEQEKFEARIEVYPKDWCRLS